MAWERKVKFKDIPFSIRVLHIGPEGELIGFLLRDAETIEAIKHKDERIFEILDRIVNEIDPLSAAMRLGGEAWYEKDSELERDAKLILSGSWSVTDEDLEHARAILEELGKKKEKAKRKQLERIAKIEHVKKRRTEFANGRSDLMLALIERDGYQCKNCDSQENLSIDHIIPLSRGGSDELSNLRILCKSCNSSKGDRYE